MKDFRKHLKRWLPLVKWLLDIVVVALRIYGGLP